MTIGGYFFGGFWVHNVTIEETAPQQVPCHGHQAPFYLGIALDHQLRQALTEQIKVSYLSARNATDQVTNNYRYKIMQTSLQCGFVSFYLVGAQFCTILIGCFVVSS